MPAFASSEERTSSVGNFPTDFELKLAELLGRRIEPDRYDLWFRKHTKILCQDNQVTIGVPNLFYQDFLQAQFGIIVKAAVAEILGESAVVGFAIDPELFRAVRAEQESAQPPKPSMPLPHTLEGNQVHLEPDPKLIRQAKRRWKSLSDFVVGACNRVAFASAQSVVEEPGQGANPLIYYGPVGTGKTHILEGIYAGLRKRWPAFRVIYITSEEFTNRFVGAMHQNKQSHFRKQFRECDVLLVDDITFFAGKRATQVEFLHTFDALIAEGQQLVMTMDSHPRLCDELMPEVIDRLLGGANWSLLPPDPATRLDLLRAKSNRTTIIPEDVLQFLAEHLRGNVRELEGAIHSIGHYSRVTGRRIDRTLVQEALGDLLRHAVRVVGVVDIDTMICEMLQLSKGSLQSKAKVWSVSHPRMIAIYLCRKHTAATYGEISIHFGNKTHSTAVAAEKKVKEWIQSDATLKIGNRQWRAREFIEKVERLLGR